MNLHDYFQQKQQAEQAPVEVVEVTEPATVRRPADPGPVRAALTEAATVETQRREGAIKEVTDTVRQVEAVRETIEEQNLNGGLSTESLAFAAMALNHARNRIGVENLALAEDVFEKEDDQEQTLVDTTPLKATLESIHVAIGAYQKSE